MVMPKYRKCDICGDSYKDEHITLEYFCTPCWFVPNHIPDGQVENVYKLRYEKAGKDYEKSEHKKMLRMRQTDS
jgi:hypothetical protein